MKYLDTVVATLLKTGARRATKYVSEKQVIRATLRLSQGKLPRANENTEIIITIGRPNYGEREFIKKCRAAKEPFPVRKIILTYPAKRK